MATELGSVTPEPCDGCDVGLCYLISFEGRRLCRNCTYAEAERLGYLDDLDELRAAMSERHQAALDRERAFRERAEAKVKAEAEAAERRLANKAAGKKDPKLF